MLFRNTHKGKLMISSNLCCGVWDEGVDGVGHHSTDWYKFSSRC